MPSANGRSRLRNPNFPAWPTDPDLAAQRNVKDLETYAGVPLRGRMPAGAGELGRAAFLSAARENLTTEVYA